MEEEGTERTELVLDWEKLLPSEDDDPPVVLIVKPTTTTTTTTQPSKQSAMGSAQRLNSQRDEGFDLLSDHELNDSIRSKRCTLETMALRLPDRGEKVRATLTRLEEEMERRKLRRVDKVFFSFIFSLLVL
jgi:ubiquitin-like-specific protease 1C/D